MSDTGRRFTDREVAIVLKNASEIDESGSAEASSGLSLEELTEIAGEVGISAEAIHRAVSGLNRPSVRLPWLGRAPLLRKAVHAVPSELNQEAVAALVRLIDERTESAGAVSEALGSVRWTSTERFKSTRVSITPAGGETSIEVVEQFVPRLRRIFHMLPAAWGVMFATVVFGRGDVTGMSWIAGAGLAFLAGLGLGRLAWTQLSARSDRRVKELAEGLAREADSASQQGMLAGNTADAPSD